MFLLPGEKLQYAETHFKFKLPWSLLYRPWPEIIFDMPFQVVPGEVPTLWIIVRDANRFPVTIETVELSIRQNNFEQTKKFQLDIKAENDFDFYPIKLKELPAGTYFIYVSATVKRLRKNKKTNTLREERKSFKRWNYSGLKAEPLIVKILAENPPKPEGFVAGEMHCHTHYSRDHVEFGASPTVLQQAAKTVGLDFVNCTDHAYDFAFMENDYTKEAESPSSRFKNCQDEIKKLNEQNRLPLMLAGEEISTGNSKNENVHMTVLAPDGYIPGLGDCGRFWFENKPTLKITQILDMTQAHCFAAHPLQQMGFLEKFIFRRGYWSEKDLCSKKGRSIRGLQFWNGSRDEGFLLGREFWIKELGKENYMLPIGGNDAHGDMNDTSAVDLPLISLKHSRAHIFGKVRTVIKTSSPLTVKSLNEAFNQDNCYVTDGPALWWERTSENSITFHARSTNDYGGGFRYIKIFGRRRSFGGKLAPHEESCIESQVAARQSTDIVVNANGFAYLRAECETASGHFALTSAAPITP